MNHVALLQALGERFAGIDVTFRRSAPAEWRIRPGINARWRVRVVTSKNERADYRFAGYGATFEDAAEATLRAVAHEDGA